VNGYYSLRPRESGQSTDVVPKAKYLFLTAFSSLASEREDALTYKKQN
jgi:hypothetical protein